MLTSSAEETPKKMTVKQVRAMSRHEFSVVEQAGLARRLCESAVVTMRRLWQIRAPPQLVFKLQHPKAVCTFFVSFCCCCMSYFGWF